MVVWMRSVTASTDLTVGRTVDWGFAATVGQRLARPGPPSTDYTRNQVVDNLATAAKAAEPPVRDVTGLQTDGIVPEARIVDRSGWIKAAAESMRAMTGGTDKPRGVISGRLTGAQTGALLAFVSSGILGQYDPFNDGGALLLVYPNVIAVERQLQARRTGVEGHRREAGLDVHRGLARQPRGIGGAEDDLVADVRRHLAARLRDELERRAGEPAQEGVVVRVVMEAHLPLERRGRQRRAARKRARRMGIAGRQAGAR